MEFYHVSASTVISECIHHLIGPNSSHEMLKQVNCHLFNEAAYILNPLPFKILFILKMKNFILASARDCG